MEIVILILLIFLVIQVYFLWKIRESKKVIIGFVAVVFLLVFVSILSSIRPSLPRELDDLKEVTSIIPINYNSENEKYVDFINRKIRECKEDRYYCLQGRIFEHLENEGLLSFDKIRHDKASVEKFFQWQERSNEEINWGNLRKDLRESFRGVIIEVNDNNNKKFIFISLRGNHSTGEGGTGDTYRHHELFFKEDINNSRLLSYKHFTFDIAGIEGLESYFFFFSLFIPLSIFFWMSYFIFQLRIKHKKKGGRNKSKI